METVILISLIAVSLIATALGIWALYDTYRKKPDPPLIFAWATGPTQIMGTVFGLAMLALGIGVGVVVVTNL